MKSYQVFVGGGTNLDLWVRAFSIVDHNKESGAPGGPRGHRARLSDTTAGPAGACRHDFALQRGSSPIGKLASGITV